MPDIRTGIVTSVGKMAKTITVTTTQMLHYPKYNVTRPRSTKFLVHDETSRAKEGDTVSIIHGKPFSRRKHYSLQSIIRSKPTVIASTSVPPPQTEHVTNTELR